MTINLRMAKLTKLILDKIIASFILTILKLKHLRMTSLILQSIYTKKNLVCIFKIIVVILFWPSDTPASSNNIRMYN